jgi:hypothetical protein
LSRKFPFAELKYLSIQRQRQPMKMLARPSLETDTYIKGMRSTNTGIGSIIKGTLVYIRIKLTHIPNIGQSLSKMVHQK